jgi:hypothetical protein
MYSKWNRRTRFFAALFTVLAAVWPASAQFQRGTIAGVVTDQADAVVVSAKVTLKNLGTNEERSAISTSVATTRFHRCYPAGLASPPKRRALRRKSSATFNWT